MMDALDDVNVLVPGIYGGVTAAEYHADPCGSPSLSNSLLTTLLQKTPRHAWLAHPRLNPAWKPDAGSDDFDLGTAAHSLLLEGVDAVQICNFSDWRTNEAKAAKAAARAAGLIPMLPHHATRLTKMMTALHAYIATTDLAGIFQTGKPEQTIVAALGGVLVRCRLDWLDLERATILDYKTTGAEGPSEWIRRNIVAHGYDTQSVLYPRALAAVTSHAATPARFIFLVQETVDPYMCYLVEPAESMAVLALNKINRGILLWRDCLGSDRWPGYPVEVHQAEAPVWALKEEELA